jgi:hypothetical protein
MTDAHAAAGLAGTKTLAAGGSALGALKQVDWFVFLEQHRMACNV